MLTSNGFALCSCWLLILLFLVYVDCFVLSALVFVLFCFVYLPLRVWFELLVCFLCGCSLV